jgi:hypothetical protein
MTAYAQPCRNEPSEPLDELVKRYEYGRDDVERAVALHALIEAVENSIVRCVVQAHTAEGCSWDALAAALEITPQAAEKRWAIKARMSACARRDPRAIVDAGALEALAATSTAAFVRSLYDAVSSGTAIETLVGLTASLRDLEHRRQKLAEAAKRKEAALRDPHAGTGQAGAYRLDNLVVQLAAAEPGLERLIVLNLLQIGVKACITRLVLTTRVVEGTSWEDIAGASGMSRQGAWQHWADRVRSFDVGSLDIYTPRDGKILGEIVARDGLQLAVHLCQYVDVKDRLEKLTALAAAQEAIGCAIDTEVNVARTLGASWGRIAHVLGVSPQAAWKRWMV